MVLKFETIYANPAAVFRDGVINLTDVTFFDPWSIGMVCLKAVEYNDHPNKQLVLPGNADALAYLKVMHFAKLMNELSYSSFLDKLNSLKVNERENSNICEIIHCNFRDEFNARLSSKIRAMFKNFGMDDNEEQLATSLVGELGNNVFDHNVGSWPTDVHGAIIVAQHYPDIKRIEVSVADPGVGFLGSLKLARPSLQKDTEAILLGLSGVTGRVGEQRGNGLRLIQDWTINKFNGKVRIHSGSGLVEVDKKDGTKERDVHNILGTLAEFVVIYN